MSPILYSPIKKRGHVHPVVYFYLGILAVYFIWRDIDLYVMIHQCSNVSEVTRLSVKSLMQSPSIHYIDLPVSEWLEQQFSLSQVKTDIRRNPLNLNLCGKSSSIDQVLFYSMLIYDCFQIISPNFVSVFGILLGFISALLIATGSRWSIITGHLHLPVKLLKILKFFQEFLSTNSEILETVLMECKQYIIKMPSKLLKYCRLARGVGHVMVPTPGTAGYYIDGWCDIASGESRVV